jgi:spore coat protein CotH
VHVESWDNELAARHFPNDSSGNIYRGIRLVSPGANLSYQGESPTPYRENYFKFSNRSADDWSDLIELTRILNNAPDTNYTAEVNRVIDVEEWMRYFAINTLVVNNETCLANGDGDDYYLYRGVVDSRLQGIALGSRHDHGSRRHPRQRSRPASFAWPESQSQHLGDSARR